MNPVNQKLARAIAGAEVDFCGYTDDEVVALAER
jgi:hypothetical protein